ncbi:MAG TPA: lasso peptide biosynthesis B2 protein [Pyrinomonadaceae bacterium]
MNSLTKTVRLSIAATRKCLQHPGDAFLMLRMAGWVGLLSLTTRLYSLPRALEIVSGGEADLNRKPNFDSANRLAQSIDLLLSADVLFLRPICWKRAAVLRRYLSRKGIPTQIIFGVRKELKNEVDGHAWLERDGQPFLEKTPPDYVVTYTFP